MLKVALQTVRTRGLLSEKSIRLYVIDKSHTMEQIIVNSVCIATSAAVSATQAASMHHNKHRFAQKTTTFLSRVWILHMIAYSQISCDRRSAMTHRRRTRP